MLWSFLHVCALVFFLNISCVIFFALQGEKYIARQKGWGEGGEGAQEKLYEAEKHKEEYKEEYIP